MEPDSHSKFSEIAHNLKTPLTSLQMMLHLLSEKKVGDLNEQQELMIDQALIDCERLVETIQGFMANRNED